MGSWYSIIKYVPDPIAGETINIGVVVYDTTKALVRFLHDWSRVKKFAGEDIAFLRDLQKTFTGAANPQMSLPDMPGVWVLDQREVELMARCWNHSVQLTEPLWSRLDVEIMLKEASAKFLKQRPESPPRRRDKTVAVHLLEDPIREELTRSYGSRGADLIQKNQFIPGKEWDTNHVDLAVGNGKKYLACNGISFEIERRQDAFETARNLAYGLKDIKGSDPEFPVAVVLLPPARIYYSSNKAFGDAQEDYGIAKRILEKSGADILEEVNAEAWARETVERVVPHDLVLDALH